MENKDKLIDLLNLYLRVTWFIKLSFESISVHDSKIVFIENGV